MMKIKRFIAAVLITVIIPEIVSAAVLGSEIISHKNTEISNGTLLYENKIMSDQKDVGQQSEYYAVYTPNSDTVPYVATGETVFGKRDALEAVKHMESIGLRPMVGINASFFSVATGVPMGHVISEKRILSADSSTLSSVGFKEDGSAFIAPLSVKVDIKTEQGEVAVSNINKYNVATIPWITLYTEDFGSQTQNDIESLTVIVDAKDAVLTDGAQIEAEVVDKFVYAGGLAIEEGKMIFSINTDGSYDYQYNLLNALSVGDKITISCSLEGDERWKEAEHGLGSQDEVLLKGGEINNSLPKGAAPRTAVGITENGSVIFYVIDGRQTGYSYGVQLKTLAERLKELGCVDAINLDGGGSTTMVGVYPGADGMSVINSPSDLRLRKVTNFIFLKNNQTSTGRLNSIYVTPQQEKYLTGTKVELSAKGIDDAYYKMDAGEVTYAVNGESKVEGNTITFIGSGIVEVTASTGNVQTVSKNEVYDEPDRIEIFADGKKVERISVKSGTNIKLSADAYVGYSRLIADSNCFTYSIEGDIGSIDAGTFKAKAIRTTDGFLKVKAGKKIIEIPVRVSNDNFSFIDTKEHWANEMIREMVLNAVVSGYKDEATGESLFRPDNNITRAEFAVMLVRLLGLSTEGAEVGKFDDVIPDWAKGYVNALYNAGYISGKLQSDGKIFFAAEDNITRAEVATIIGRILGNIEIDVSKDFADSDKIPSWAKNYISSLTYAGILSGYEDGTVKPLSNVTRAEAVTMLYKFKVISK